MKTLRYFLFFICFLPCISNAQQLFPQDSISKIFNIEELFGLAVQNNQSLKISSAGLLIAKQGIEVAKNQRLPAVSASLTAGYLGDALLIENDFSKSTQVAMPHFANSFALEASQLIFRGNAVNNAIASASLQEQLAKLDFEENTLGIKLLVAGNYFD